MIFCFSGTGNSLITARYIAEKTGDRILPISQRTAQGDYRDEKSVGLVYPTYFYSAPELVKDFALTLQISRDAYIFLIATCGGGPGSALQDVADILEKRGFKVSLARSFTMPDNTAALFGRKYDRSTLETHELHANALGTDIADRDIEIADLKKRSGLMSLVSAAGGPSMRFMGSRLRADKDRCVKCGLCARVCPKGNITVTEDGVKFGKDCACCLSCLHWCPQGAVKLGGRSFGPEKQYRCPGVTAGDIEELRK